MDHSELQLILLDFGANLSQTLALLTSQLGSARRYITLEFCIPTYRFTQPCYVSRLIWFCYNNLGSVTSWTYKNMEKEILGRILHLVCSIYTYGVPLISYCMETIKEFLNIRCGLQKKGTLHMTYNFNIAKKKENQCNFLQWYHR